MDIKDYISVAAILFSSLALALGIWNRILNERMAKSNLYLTRYSDLEKNLVSWSDAFKLYDTDIEQAKKEGVTPEMIAYLVLFINSIHAECKSDGIDIKTELANSDLKRRVLSNPASIKTWKYAKNNFSAKVTFAIDTFIRSQV